MKRILEIITVILLFSIPGLCTDIFYADGPKTKKAIALTFDDGPGPYTERILEVLKKYNVKATFFMEGELLAFRGETAKKVLADGNEIGSHTYSHQNFWYYTKSDYKELLIRELDRTDKVFNKVFGWKPKLLRMPNGYVKPWVKEIAKQKGYILINWTFGEDWDKKSSEELAADYEKHIRNGSILLMHDGGKDRHRTLEMLPKVIEEAQSRGYEILTISELLGLK